jgi:hypothetical protein
MNSAWPGGMLRGTYFLPDPERAGRGWQLVDLRNIAPEDCKASPDEWANWLGIPHARPRLAASSRLSFGDGPRVPHTELVEFLSAYVYAIEQELQASEQAETYRWLILSGLACLDLGVGHRIVVVEGCWAFISAALDIVTGFLPADIEVVNVVRSGTRTATEMPLTLLRDELTAAYENATAVERWHAMRERTPATWRLPQAPATPDEWVQALCRAPVLMAAQLRDAYILAASEYRRLLAVEQLLRGRVMSEEDRDQLWEPRGGSGGPISWRGTQAQCAYLLEKHGFREHLPPQDKDERGSGWLKHFARCFETGGQEQTDKFWAGVGRHHRSIFPNSGTPSSQLTKEQEQDVDEAAPAIKAYLAPLLTEAPHWERQRGAPGRPRQKPGE